MAAVTAPANQQPKNESIEKFFRSITAPQRIALIIFGLYENPCSNAAAVSYNVYFLFISGLCGFIIYGLSLELLNDLGIRCLTESVFLTSVDKFSYIIIDAIFLYKIVISVIFVVWILKFKKLSSFLRICQHDDFGILEDIMRHKRWTKTRTKYIIISYISFIYFVLYALVNLCAFLRLRETMPIQIVGIAITLMIMQDLIVCSIMAISTAVYLFIASLWDVLNDDLAHQATSKDNTEELDKVLDDYTAAYDGLTELTGKAAELFRLYTTIHVASVINIVVLIYLTNYLPMDNFILTDWFQTVVEFGALWAAAYIHSCSGATAEKLYKFYKSRSHNASSEKLRQKFDAFYQRVAHEWAPVKLDILGMIPINYAMLGLSAFTAVNWIAILLQFRQGVSADDFKNATSYCDDRRAEMMNKTYNSTFR